MRPLQSDARAVDKLRRIRHLPASRTGRFGGVAERSMAADCKSAGFSLRWFKSNPLHQFLFARPVRAGLSSHKRGRACGGFAAGFGGGLCPLVLASLRAAGRPCGALRRFGWRVCPLILASLRAAGRPCGALPPFPVGPAAHDPRFAAGGRSALRRFAPGLGRGWFGFGLLANSGAIRHQARPVRGYSTMVVQQPSKLNTRVRFPLPAPSSCPALRARSFIPNGLRLPH